MIRLFIVVLYRDWLDELEKKRYMSKLVGHDPYDFIVIGQKRKRFY